LNPRQVESIRVGAGKRDACDGNGNDDKGERENAGQCELLANVNLNSPEEIDGNEQD
jgi:hypothetical protein